MQRLLVLNLFISLMWPILNNDYTFEALLLGFILGFVLTSLVQRRYGPSTQFGPPVLSPTSSLPSCRAICDWQARYLPTPSACRLRCDRASLQSPLDLTNPFDITVLATVITLTPGTLSVDLGEDVSGRLWPYGEPEENAIGTDQKEVSDACNPRKSLHSCLTAQPVRATEERRLCLSMQSTFPTRRFSAPISSGDLRVRSWIFVPSYRGDGQWPIPDTGELS